MTHPTTTRRVRRVVVALTSTLSLLGALALGSTQAVAAPLDSGPTSRATAFARAAQDYGVPQQVLEAVSYAQSRWEAHAGEHNTDGGYGPMNLVDGTLFAGGQADGRNGTDGSVAGSVPAGVDTLGRAATLLGVKREVLREDADANIRGGAALLAATQARLGLPTGTTSDPGQWYATVADASHASDEADAASFADETYAVMAAGAARTTTDGKDVTLMATPTTAQKDQIGTLRLHRAKPDPHVECPPRTGVRLVAGALRAVRPRRG